MRRLRESLLRASVPRLCVSARCETWGDWTCDCLRRWRCALPWVNRPLSRVVRLKACPMSCELGGGGWLVVMAAARAVSAGCWAEPGRYAIVIMHFALWFGMKCVLCGLVKWICGARTRTLSV